MNYTKKSFAQLQKMNKREREIYGKTIPKGSTPSAVGNLSSYKYSDSKDCEWAEYFHDLSGNETHFIDDTGYWFEKIYNKNNKEIMFSNSNNYFSINGIQVTNQVYKEVLSKINTKRSTQLKK